jgi:hypothetical protein
VATRTPDLYRVKVGFSNRPLAGGHSLKNGLRSLGQFFCSVHQQRSGLHRRTSPRSHDVSREACAAEGSADTALAELVNAHVGFVGDESANPARAPDAGSSLLLFTPQCEAIISHIGAGNAQLT